MYEITIKDALTGESEVYECDDYILGGIDDGRIIVDSCCDNIREASYLTDVLKAHLHEDIMNKF